MNLLDATLVLAAGIGAGTINTIVGSGSLITFPTLVALGFPPVTANVSNNIGLVPGTISGTYGYREELKGQRGRLLRLGSASLIGSAVGALLLLRLPAEAFKVIVPGLIAIALLLVAFQPRLQAWMKKRHEEAPHRPNGGPWLWAGVLAAGVYGGYFGAAQGIVLIAMLGIALDDDLQRLNGAKNALAGVVNSVAAVLFIAIWLLGDTDINWWVVLMIAVGSTIGGQLGARVGRRIPPVALRGVIIAVGLVAIVNLLA